MITTTTTTVSTGCYAPVDMTALEFYELSVSIQRDFEEGGFKHNEDFGYKDSTSGRGRIFKYDREGRILEVTIRDMPLVPVEIKGERADDVTHVKNELERVSRRGLEEFE